MYHDPFFCLPQPKQTTKYGPVIQHCDCCAVDTPQNALYAVIYGTPVWLCGLACERRLQAVWMPTSVQRRVSTRSLVRAACIALCAVFL